mgnify:FL=1
MPARMEPGNPAMQVVMHLDYALGVLLEIGMARIEVHARDLSELVSKGLEKLGFRVISPKARAARSGNTCFLCEDAKGMERQLAEGNVLVWGEFSRVRISAHLYNSSADVGRLLDAVVDVG